MSLDLTTYFSPLIILWISSGIVNIFSHKRVVMLSQSHNDFELKNSWYQSYSLDASLNLFRFCLSSDSIFPNKFRRIFVLTVIKRYFIFSPIDRQLTPPFRREQKNLSGHVFYPTSRLQSNSFTIPAKQLKLTHTSQSDFEKKPTSINVWEKTRSRCKDLTISDGETLKIKEPKSSVGCKSWMTNIVKVEKVSPNKRLVTDSSIKQWTSARYSTPLHDLILTRNTQRHQEIWSSKSSHWSKKPWASRFGKNDLE